MSKVLRITDNDYKVIVSNGGNITLDTTNGALDGAGRVIVTGDLEIRGDTTTVESTITTFADNVILLNEGNTGLGLPASLDRPYSSGIAIDRGQYAPSRWVYDDSITWTLGGTSGIGTWTATTGYVGVEQTLPLATPGIIAGGDLYISVGAGVVTVTGSTNYEEKVWRYENGTITPDPLTSLITIDDDNIPNTKAVKDYVDYSINFVEISKIQEDNSQIVVKDTNHIISGVVTASSTTTIATPNSHGYIAGDQITISGVTQTGASTQLLNLNGTFSVVDVPSKTLIEVNVSTSGATASDYTPNSGITTGAESKIEVQVEGTVIGDFYDNRIEFAGIELKDGQIQTVTSNQDLVLSAPGTGAVKIKDMLELTKTPGDDDGAVNPALPNEGVRIYSKEPSEGKTGIYFVNEDNNNDELISKNRALLLSIIF
jgi:hypothetical protein